MPARARVSFATCNLYNLNLPGRTMYRDNDGWTDAQFDAKVAWMARALQSVDADVWGFQELWHADALRAVFEAAGLTAAYTLVVPPDHDGSSIVNAAAVRNGLLEGEGAWLTEFPPRMRLSSRGDDAQTPDIDIRISGFSRPLLRFVVRPLQSAAAIDVVVAHLKSKRPTEIYREGWYRDDNEYLAAHRESLGSALSTIRRTAEAAALRVLLTDLTRDSDRPVVVMGDLNDGHRSNTLALVTGAPNYLIGLSTGGSDTDLYATGALQNYRSQRDVYYSYIHGHEHESLDHILVSQEFYDNARRRVWAFDGLQVFNDHLNYADHKANGTTDHGIVRVEFEHRPA